MANRKQRLASLALSLALAGLNLIALNYLISGWSTARVDLTGNGVFSISPATKRILTNLDEEVTVYGFFSSRTHPKLAPLVPEIADLLDEYRAVSKGRVHVEIVDPGEDEEIESEAADRFGVQSSPFRLASKYESAIVNAYFALVVKYGDQYVRYGFQDLIHVEPLPDGDIDVRLRNLEYDLTRAVKKVVYGFRSTNELFERIDQPAKLLAIWTPDALPDVFGDTPDALRKAVAELKEAGGDKFVFEEVDPSEGEPVRQEVYERYGARPMSLGLFGDGEEFYLYALLEVGGQLEQLVLTRDTVTAASLRESIEDSLRRHTPGFLKTVGVVAPDPPQIPPQLRMQMQMPPQPPPEFEEIQSVLREDYQVTKVNLDDEGGVPGEIDVLLVLKPSDLSEQALFGLDQYLMRGGRVIICASQYSVDFSPNGLFLTPLSTGLESWLEHHGVTVTQSLVLDDRNQPLPIPQVRQTPFGAMRTWALEPYPYLVQVRDEGFMTPEITASLDAVGIYWGSPLVLDPEAISDLDVRPILQSSAASWTSDDLSQVGYVDYEVPAEGTEPHLLAVALSGRFQSYYTDREPPSSEPVPEPDPESADAEQAQPSPPPVVLQESPETRLVVVANSEFLSDFVARALAQVDGGFFDENLRFAQNLIDWVGLDNDMLSIRARGMVSRRLARVEKSEEIVIETVNYVVPVVILVLLAMYLHWKRRQTRPLSAEGDVAVSTARTSRGEA